MQIIAPETLARAVAEQLAVAHPDVARSGLREDLIRQVAKALRTAVQLEREAVAGLCRERQRLWEATEQRPQTPEPMRAEARARANEAAYLGDAIVERAG